jgi:thiamine transport system permease protein
MREHVHKAIAPLVIIIAIALGLLPLIAFAIERGGAVWPDAYVWRVARFTLLQAGLSTLLSVFPAIIIARALVRRQFIGRSFLLSLFAVPQSLPVIVAVFGLTALSGTAGLFGGWFQLYGLGGIVLAHVFFNLPLATRLCVEALLAIAPENHRLAAQLGFSDSATFRNIDWPALKPVLPRVAALIFLLCAGSFVIVLVFGGPAATTLEVAIYQSLRMDFDVTRALTLSLVQVLLSLVMVWTAARMLVAPSTQAALRIDTRRFDGEGTLAKVMDITAIAAAAMLVLPVLIAIAAQGLVYINLNGALLQALTTSIGLATLSCMIALPLAWGLGEVQRSLPRFRSTIVALGLAAFIVPPAVIATGWFLAFRSVNTLALTIFLIAGLNALMALPFILSVLTPAQARNFEQHDKLCQQLNLRGWTRLRLIDIPSMRAPLAQAALMAFVLSMGDLTAVTLLGSKGLLTLPSLVQQQMGHYQSTAAGGTALVLAMLCFGLSMLAQRMARWT